MGSGYDYKRYAVLYVDDEERSLKYFRRAFEPDFRVLVAPSAEEAWKVLEREGDEVGVLVSDQRMPGESGTELLGKVRRTRPGIVRVLTTAYSDLESAVEAVNSGGAFRYVTKPWDIRDLRGVLLRAMEFFLIQKERDLLLREKLSVLQRLVITDRVRSLAVLAAGLAHHIRNSMNALVNFLDLVPEESPAPDPSVSVTPAMRTSLWGLARLESERILKIVQQVGEATTEPASLYDGTFALGEILEAGISAVRADASWEGTVEVDVSPELPPLTLERTLASRMFSLLLLRAARFNGGKGRVWIRAHEEVPVWGAKGVRVRITTDGAAWPERRIASLFTPFAPDEDDPAVLGLDLLSAFFIAHHHGGDIVVHRDRPEGPGFEVLLPVDPASVQRPSLEENCLEKLFTHFETWDAER